MARIPINGVYADGEGNIVVSGNATIYEFKSADPSNPDTIATIYAAETGGSAIATGIVTTDSNGIYEAWIDDSDYSGNQIFTVILSKSTHTDPPIQFGLPGLSFKDTSETLTNKTLTSPVLTLPQIDDTSEDHQYVFAVNELSADRTVTLPLLTGNDTFTFNDFAATLTNKKLTKPKIITDISDTNGNELLKVTATGSAINEITLANAAIGNDPTLTASGGDTNIGINLVPKGTGNIQAGGNVVATLASFLNYRVGGNCKQASSSTITVEAVEIIVNGVSVIKTTDTTVSLGTAGDWVDNESERAVSTYGYVYINAAGVIELDDQAPDASDPDDNTSGILRYNNTGTDTSWRRCIGEFYMNSTGSGELDADGVWNFDELNVLPRSFLTGLVLSNGTDADHDIDIAAGECRDSANDTNMRLVPPITKQIDATWAVGTAAGGLSSSLTAPANDTWYHVHQIIVAGVVDVGFDTSITAANLVTDHSATAFRRIGSVLTDGSANILAFVQNGDDFAWDVPVRDWNATNPGTSAVTQACTVPTGVIVYPKLAISLDDGTIAADIHMLVTALSQTDTAASGSNFSIKLRNSSVAVGFSSFISDVWTNTSSQIRTRLSVSNADIDTEGICHGWKDRRGRDA